MFENYTIIAHLITDKILNTNKEKNFIIAILNLWNTCCVFCNSIEQVENVILDLSHNKKKCLLVVDNLNEYILSLLNEKTLKYEIILINYENNENQFSKELLAYVNHFLNFSQGHLANISFISALNKIFNREIFGIDKYLSYGTPCYHTVLQNSVERDTVIDEMSKYVENLSPFIKFSVKELSRISVEILDEFMMNAIWDANPNKNSIDRSTPVFMPHNETISVEWGTDGQLLVIGVKDSFGTLQKSIGYNYIDEVLGTTRLKTYEIKADGYGAGLGLHIVFRKVSGLIINIAPSFCTEMIAIIDLRRPLKYLNKGPKTFHIFSL